MSEIKYEQQISNPINDTIIEMQENKQAYWSMSINDILNQLDSNRANGLSQEQVEKKLLKHGLNEFEKQKGESIWDKIKEQFEDILVRILLLAAIVSFIISLFESEQEDIDAIPAWVEPAVIFTILICNALIGIWQDLDAEKAIDALQEYQVQQAQVLRNGQWQVIHAINLVPGDIVQVNQGDRIPADLRIIEKSLTLRVDQSILTGESETVCKIDQVISEGNDIISKQNMLFSGTFITNGTSVGVVCQTGMQSYLGQIINSIKLAEEESKAEQTPLKQKLDEFGDFLSKVITIICFVCWIINIHNFSDPQYGGWANGAMYYFKTAVALAVAAIPEGLPAVITTCLALGSRRMAKKNAIIRKLQSIETLGCTTIICTDKTGTLTTNQMTAQHFLLAMDEDPSVYQSFEVQDQAIQQGQQLLQCQIPGLQDYINEIDNNKSQQDQIDNLFGNTFPKNLQYLLSCMVICNESKIALNSQRQQIDKNGQPTEIALKILAEKIGLYDLANNNNKEQQIAFCSFLSSQYKKLLTLEFSQDRKAMSVLAKHNQSQKSILFIKGAPENLIQNSKQILSKSGQLMDCDAEVKSQLQQEVKKLTQKGLRTLAICLKFDLGILSDYEINSKNIEQMLSDVSGYSQIEENPIFVGLVAMRDPPRIEVKQAIEKCKTSGISVIMVTGDNKETAMSIAKDVGILYQDEDNSDRVITGYEFDKQSNMAQQGFLEKVTSIPSGMVFSRATPSNKRTLVQLLGQMNQIVLMTGDGVNDAPALKQGVAMNITGTEAAKEAADMILVDDNFSTIVAAIEEGRSIYENMKAFIRYMISSNIGEVVCIFLSSLLGIPDGLNSTQLLWINLVTDGLPATALSFNPSDQDAMKRPPRKKDEPLLNKFALIRFFLIGSYVGFATVYVFIYWYLNYSWANDGHELVSFYQLRNWGECKDWEGFKVSNYSKYDFSENACKYFTFGKQKASTLSVTVLVVIEMFNALNALSDQRSLFKIGLISNPFLLYAIASSIGLHCLILYVPFFEGLFNTVPLDGKDWLLVILISFPVIIIDEIIKAFVRRNQNKNNRRKYK